MFVTSPETHLYGGPSIPLGYHSLSGTFSGVASIPWTYPMSSNSRIVSRTSLMNATNFAPLHSAIPTIEKQSGPYINGECYTQQPNSPYFGYHPFGLQLPSSSSPP